MARPRLIPRMIATLSVILACLTATFVAALLFIGRDKAVHGYYPFILMVFVGMILLVFAGVFYWISRLRQNIALLYLSLGNDGELQSELKAPLYQEFWRVAEWNKAVALQLQETAQFRNTLFENSPCGIMVVDPTGAIMETNARGWELLKRVAREEEINSIPVIAPEFKEVLKKVMSGKTHTGELTLPTAQGEVAYIYAVSPVQTATCKGALIFWLDQTEVKQLGFHLRQNERYRLVGELACMAAHELRNPLTTIIANAQLGQMIQDEQKQKELYLRIQQASHRMSDILQEMMGLCRPGEAELSPVDVVTVLSEVLGLVRAQLLTQGIELEWKNQEKVPRVWGKNKLLRQVFLNVIQNAIQAMPSGGKLTVKAYVSGGEVVVSVRDSGMGIPHELQNQIFKSFITTKENGNGLGLFITRQIMVGNFGGRVWFSSVPGEGAEFYLAFHSAESLAQGRLNGVDKPYWTVAQSMVQ